MNDESPGDAKERVGIRDFEDKRVKTNQGAFLLLYMGKEHTTKDTHSDRSLVFRRRSSNGV